MLTRIASHIQVIDDLELREQERSSLNRICNLVDWQAWNPLTNMIRTLNDSATVHRKSWEYASCILGLQELGAVHPEAKGLAVGAGCERPLFYFANHITEMVATDLYDLSHDEGRPGMLEKPEQFAPFPYRTDRLQVLRMSGDDLQFPNETFDFVFCLSSIEHFGSRAIQAKCLQEMRRVIKPGGIISIATELILNEATHPEFFTYPELEQTFLRAQGLALIGGPLDLRIAKSLVEYPILMDRTNNSGVAPHIVLFAHGVMWTSVMLFLQRI